MAKTNAAAVPTRLLAWLLTIGGAFGLLASYEITIDKFRLLENPAFVPSCSINPVISCGTIMQSQQAAAFGFPNPFLGLAGYSMVIVVGVALLAGADFKAWFWRLFNLGALFGVGFVHWLFFESVFRIQALCPWCMVAWTVTIPIFWFTLLYSLQNGFVPSPAGMRGAVKFISGYKYVILLLWYLAIAAAILVHFWYYFKTVI